MIAGLLIVLAAVDGLAAHRRSTWCAITSRLARLVRG
jgi:hypothetical protein